jgi:hypothetical protein
MNVTRDSSDSCVVCVWFEMLKMRLYKDDLMEIDSKTKKQTNKQIKIFVKI